MRIRGFAECMQYTAGEDQMRTLISEETPSILPDITQGSLAFPIPVETPAAVALILAQWRLVFADARGRKLSLHQAAAPVGLPAKGAGAGAGLLDDGQDVRAQAVLHVVGDATACLPTFELPRTVPQEEPVDAQIERLLDGAAEIRLKRW